MNLWVTLMSSSVHMSMCSNDSTSWFTTRQNVNYLDVAVDPVKNVQCVFFVRATSYDCNRAGHLQECLNWNLQTFVNTKIWTTTTRKFCHVTHEQKSPVQAEQAIFHEYCSQLQQATLWAEPIEALFLPFLLTIKARHADTSLLRTSDFYGHKSKSQWTRITEKQSCCLRLSWLWTSNCGSQGICYNRSQQ